MATDCPPADEQIPSQSGKYNLVLYVYEYCAVLYLSTPKGHEDMVFLSGGRDGGVSAHVYLSRMPWRSTSSLCKDFFWESAFFPLFF